MIDIDGFTVEINLLNTSFFSLLHENDQGLHYMPPETISKISSPTGAMMAIALMHHSHQWLYDGCKREAEKALLEKNTMIFADMSITLQHRKLHIMGGAPARVFCGGSLCNMGDWSDSEFLLAYMTQIRRDLRSTNLDGRKTAKYTVAAKSKRDIWHINTLQIALKDRTGSILML